MYLGCHKICFFFKQKTAYEMRISDWSSDVCSSDLRCLPHVASTKTVTQFIEEIATPNVQKWLEAYSKQLADMKDAEKNKKIQEQTEVLKEQEKGDRKSVV